MPWYSARKTAWTDLILSDSKNIRALILNRPLHASSLQTMRCPERPDRIGQQRASQDHQVRLAVSDDRFGQIRAMNQADRARHHSRLRLDGGCERRLVAGMNRNP